MSQTTPNAPGHHDDIPPVDMETPHFTVRAVATGAILGAILSVTNIYAGLKIGWGFNMSIAAALIGYGLWQGLAHGVFKRRSYNMLENNVAQTGASAAASISSAGLVSAVPALTMLEKYEWTYPALAIWVLCCSMLGVFVAIIFRRQMLINDKLPFAGGVATAETLREMYAKGAEAMARLKALLLGAGAAAVLKVIAIVAGWKTFALPGSFALSSTSPLVAKGVGAASTYNLTFALDPSVLLFGSGIIVGIRTGIWMLIGAIVAWGIIGFNIIDSGAIGPAYLATPKWFYLKEIAKLWPVVNTEVPWFSSMVNWLLWPGVAMLVTSSLTSLAFSAPAFARAFRSSGSQPKLAVQSYDVSPRMTWIGIAIITIVTIIAASALFGMDPGVSFLGVALTMLLAVVALRVTGETNVTPVGAMGKVTQLTFAVVDPKSTATNLMAANITGGSASQAADMMHDLKTGLLLGCSPKSQALSQMVGVIAGALVGSFAYLILVPDPAAMLGTPEWPAPAVQQWAGVAKVFKNGIESLPPGVISALWIAAALGVVMAVVEKITPPKIRKWMPSPTAIGIAFCIPAWNAISMFLGGVVGHALKKMVPNWHARFAIVMAAGLVVGESLVGLVDAFMKLL